MRGEIIQNFLASPEGMDGEQSSSLVEETLVVDVHMMMVKCQLEALNGKTNGCIKLLRA